MRVFTLPAFLTFSAIGARLSAVPVAVWRVIIPAVFVIVLVFAAYAHGVSAERDRWLERVAAAERKNAQLTAQIQKQAIEAEAGEQARRELEDRLNAQLNGNSDIDLFPDGWLRDLNRSR